MSFPKNLTPTFLHRFRQAAFATRILPYVTAVAIVFFAAIILTLPMLIEGPAADGHDTFEHLTYNRHFSQQFWAGEWYPRWLSEMNRGLGSASFFVFPPFPSYLYAFLGPISGAVHTDPFKVEMFLVLFVSGLTCFFWLDGMATRSAATVASVLYMLMPYHLAVDYYRRTALPECWALAWMPLLLCSMNRMRCGKSRAIAGFALAYALLIVSHLISALIFSPVLLSAAFILSPVGSRLRITLRVAGGMFLGAGLSSFYLLSALEQSRYFPAQVYVPRLSEALISLRTLLAASGFDHTVAVSTVDTVAVTAVCGAILLVKGSPQVRMTAAFWLAVCGGAGFLMSSLSVPVWKLSSALLLKIQYPFRLNILVCLGAVWTLAALMSEPLWSSRRGSALLLLLLFVAAMPWILSYGMVWKFYRTQKLPQSSWTNEAVVRLHDDGWFQAWTAPGLNETSALAASKSPRVRLRSGLGMATASSWHPRHIKLEAVSPVGGAVIIGQFYYPEWKAALVPASQHGLRTAVETKVALPEGLLEVDVPPGKWEVLLDIAVSTAEKVGFWFSLAFGVLVSIIGSGMLFSERS